MSFSTYRSIFSRSFIKTYHSPEGTACIILCDQDKLLNKQYAQYWKCLKYRKGSGEYLSQVGIRLSCLLERVGLTQDQDADAIQSFLDVRNDSVHPRVRRFPLMSLPEAPNPQFWGLRNHLLPQN